MKMRKLIVYIPRDHDKIDYWRRYLLERFTQEFGGATYYYGVGSYLMKSTGSLVAEGVTVIWTLTTKDELNQFPLDQILLSMREDLGEESVLYTIEKVKARFV